MVQAAWGLLVTFLSGILAKVVNATWDDLWERIFEGVALAKQKWQDEIDKGPVKREEVIEYVTAWVHERRPLNVVERWVVRILVGNVVDVVIKEVNDALGKDWVKKAKAVEANLADWLPLIDGVTNA